MVAGLPPSPQDGHTIVTVRAISSTVTVSGTAHWRHHLCRVTALTCVGDATHW
nr:hypothetical protein JVH1_0690 [Rhodococcus sp. JVH1]